MTIQIMGAGIGPLHVGGHPGHYAWRVSYERDGGRYFHEVDSRLARDSMEAIEVAKRELGFSD
ncbi:MULTISPECIES: hypothetical protein [Bradyrhizobium]